MPSPGGKVPPKGADEERRQLTTRSAVKLRAYSLQNSTFFTNCVYSRYISPLLISLASLDSFPPGEAMGAPAPVQLCSPLAEQCLPLWGRWPSVSEVGRGSCHFAETQWKNSCFTALFRPSVRTGAPSPEGKALLAKFPFPYILGSTCRGALRMYVNYSSS